MIGLYAKALAGAVVAGAGAWISALNDEETPGLVTTSEIVSIVVATVVALGVVALIPNSPRWVQLYVPALVSAVVALGSQLVIALPGGIEPAELLSLLIIVLSALGITAAVPNARASDPPGGVVPAVDVVAKIGVVEDQGWYGATTAVVAGPASPIPDGMPVTVEKLAA